MQTAGPALPVVRTEGSHIFLADGRVLIDGIASWWTACHGYNHPHIAQAVRTQLERMPHVMFGGLGARAGLYFGASIGRTAAGPAACFLFRFRIGRGRSGDEDRCAVLDQSWRERGVRRFLSFTGGYHGDTLATMSVCDPDEGMHARFAGLFPAQVVVALPADAMQPMPAFEPNTCEAHAHELAGVIVEPLVQGAGGMLFHDPAVLRRAACRLRPTCDCR